MIPHSSAGGQPWNHQTRALGGGSGRMDSAHDLAPGSSQVPVVSSQAQPQAQPQTRQPAVMVDLTSHDREPPSKRPKLDISIGTKVGEINTPVNGGEGRNTPGGVSSRPQLSWRGRPMWSFQAVMSDLSSSENRSDHTPGLLSSSPPPFPALPWTKSQPDQLGDTGVRTTVASADKKVQTCPYRIETPSAAPILKGESKCADFKRHSHITDHHSGVADFTPWTGNHPEDILNEQTAKQGYYDRTQVSQNESNTARPALYGQLKHRTGLQMLSTVFSAALEKRQVQNTVHTSSTFKPPPRVTLTDNKREAWLRDLASSSVPLRRLSRTIPHGIRGKVLLDQCLGKWIPVSRAVWLAKCVGANEIRAFKRKGTSGALAVGLEAKWVRDWTTNVHQFVDGVFNAPKSSDWKAKMTYAVGLTARLFFENLLDHDHFLEWFLSSFEAASLVTTPVWVLMLGIYWKNLTRYRRRGRRLAEILLEKLRQTTEVKLEPLQPLIDRLTHFIKKLIHEHTSSLILPDSWDIYKSQVASCLNLSLDVDRALLQSLAERNARVQKPRSPKQSSQRSPNQCLIHLLDSIHSACDLNSTSSACMDIFENKATLVSKLLEWAGTPFRYGVCRVYVGARLLRKWKALGIDVDGHILAFLAQLTHHKNSTLTNVYHIIAELVKSQTFSVGRYLQWLVAKGITSRPPSECQSMHDLSSDILLIKQLPISRLPDHVGNLRNILLARIGCSASNESNTIANVKGLISSQLPNIFDCGRHAPTSLGSIPVDLTWVIKSDIGQWLRQGVAEYTRNGMSLAPQAASYGERTPSVSKLTPEEFYIIRGILEDFDDISMLADVLKCASNSENSVVLASVSDTANCYFDSLNVMGATSDLFRRLVDAYANIKRSNIPSLDLMFSLIELGLRIPHELQTVVRLRHDLTRMENKAVLAASSPISDHVPDTLSDADPSFREKLDHLLLSGNVMDEPTLDAIFNTLTKHLALQVNKLQLSVHETCRYLSQLRCFQPKHFDAILARWICTLLRSADRSVLLRTLPSLIGVGCVTIRSLLSLIRRIGDSKSSIPNMIDLPVDLVELLVLCEDENTPLDLVSYRFKLSQQEFLTRNCDEVFNIVCDATAALQTYGADKYKNLKPLTAKLLRELLVRNPSFPQRSCTKKIMSEFPSVIPLLRDALDDLLGLDPQNEQQSIISEIENLASATDDFSLPFCQLKLQIHFHENSRSHEDRNNIADAMFKTVPMDSKSRWIELVALMAPDAIRQIRERAEKEFFAIPIMEEEPEGHSSSSAPHNLRALETAKQYLAIVEELAGSIPDVGASTVASVVIERMDTILHKIVTLRGNLKCSRDQQSGPNVCQDRLNFERSLAFWFSALLRMVVIHRASFLQPPTSKSISSHEQARLLTTIFCIALSRLPGNVLRFFPGADYFPRSVSADDYHPCPGVLLQTHALDIAATLIDVFPDEARYQCSRFLRERCSSFGLLQNDSRFIYLLGPLGDFTTISTQQSASAPSPAASTAPPSSNLPTSSTQSPVVSSGMYTSETVNLAANRLRIQHHGRVAGSYPIRPWELLEDAAPFLGVNDTAINLGYFDARRVQV